MELRMPTWEQVETVYHNDLVPSFPASELKPLRAIGEMWRDGWYRPWCLFDGDEIVGECFLWLGRPGWLLLDYLCVSPQWRNSGTGALILEKMLEREEAARQKAAERRRAKIESQLISAGGQILKRGLMGTLFGGSSRRR